MYNRIEKSSEVFKNYQKSPKLFEILQRPATAFMRPQKALQPPKVPEMHHNLLKAFRGCKKSLILKTPSKVSRS